MKGDTHINVLVFQQIYLVVLLLQEYHFVLIILGFDAEVASAPVTPPTLSIKPVKLRSKFFQGGPHKFNVLLWNKVTDFVPKLCVVTKLVAHVCALVLYLLHLPQIYN